jgi:hypothetical protein
MEREWASTGNLDLLLPINRVRRQAGLPPHPDARIILANNALFKLVPRFAQQLLTALEVYDEIDIPMYIFHLRELRGGDDFDENEEIDIEGEAGTLIELVKSLTDEIRQLESERRDVSLAGIDLSNNEDFSPEYENLRRRHGIDEISLGEIPEIPSEDEDSSSISFFSPQHLAIRARSGFEEAGEQIGWLDQVISRRALRIYRKALAYGALPTIQIIEQTPAIIEEWYDYELAELDDLADKIEMLTNEIVDVAQGFGPSPEIIRLLSNSWYGEAE